MKILPTAYRQLPTEKRDEGRGKRKSENVDRDRGKYRH